MDGLNVRTPPTVSESRLTVGVLDLDVIEQIVPSKPLSECVAGRFGPQSLIRTHRQPNVPRKSSPLWVVLMRVLGDRPKSPLTHAKIQSTSLLELDLLLGTLRVVAQCARVCAGIGQLTARNDQAFVTWRLSP